MSRPWSFLCVCVCAKNLPYSPPSPPQTGVQVSTVADWPLFLVVSRLAFFFLLLRTSVCMRACVWVSACVILFPDLELIPFKTLLKTLMWDWFMFASTIAPPFRPPPPQPTRQSTAGRSNQSITKKVFDGILNAICSQICVVYCIWYTLLDSYVNLH